ncbi:hypothetical protein GBF38_017425, partial [Nibea albiflora]
MPRKGKRSQAAKLRYQKFHEFRCASTTEQAECVGPQNSGKAKMSVTSNASVKQVCQLDATHVPQVSYADIVKTGLINDDQCVAVPSNPDCVNLREQTSIRQASYADIVKTGLISDDQCVAGPSNPDYVNLRDQPSEQYVCASRSQASVKYGKSRNQQCTCNSLTFLAFLHENENLSREDLDLVLDKGNLMYNEAKKKFPKHIHLTTDELPDIVPSRTCIQYVDMTQLSRYGTFGDPLPGAVDSFLDLEAGLSCLLSDVQYALLLMRGLCIAVFRTMSGRYGFFFDPHPRTVKGLPLPLDSRAPGTGVMVTFTHLSDMIDRLIKYHKTLETNASCNYELKPVAFVNLNDPKPVAFVNLNDPKPVAFVNLNDPKPVAFVNLNDPKPVAFVNLNDPNLDKTSQATTHTAAVSTFALDDNVLHDISRKLSKLG